MPPGRAGRSRAPQASVTAQAEASWRRGGELLDLATRDRARRSAQSAIFSTSVASAVRSSPTMLDEGARRLADRPASAGALEARSHPAREVARPRRVVRQHLARPRATACASFGAAKRLLRDEREHGAGRRLPEVGLDRPDVLGLPALDVLDDDEPSALAGKETERVAGGDRVLSRRRLGGERLDGLGAEARAQAPKREADLRPVAAGQEVDGLERLLAHRAEHSGRSGTSSMVSAPSARRSASVGLDRDAAVAIGAVERSGLGRARAPRASRASGARSRCRRPTEMTAMRGRTRARSSGRLGVRPSRGEPPSGSRPAAVGAEASRRTRRRR